MEPEIKFFMLQRPRSVSDMLTALTTKELSPDPDRRSEQIPRYAGNWFREGSGYLWRLQDRGEIEDIGRKYALDPENLVDGFLEYLGVRRAFPYYAQQGSTAELTDAYSEIMEPYTYGRLRRKLLDTVFSGEVMSDLFTFDRWHGPLMVPEPDGRRIASHRLVFDFYSSVHFMLLSSVLKSRYTRLQEIIESVDDDEVPDEDVAPEEAGDGEELSEDGRQYFEAKNRLARLDETRDTMRREIVRACFPWARTFSWEDYTDRRVEAVSRAFIEKGTVIPEEAVSLLSDMYLLSLNDGVQLYRQQTRFGQDNHLFFELCERGWLIDPDTVETHTGTGNLILPLHAVRSYIQELARLCRPTGVVMPE